MISIITVLIINKYYQDLDKELMLEVEVSMFEKSKRKFKAEYIAGYLLKRVKITKDSKPFLLALLIDILNLIISIIQFIILNKEISNEYEINFLNYFKIANVFPTLSICRINKYGSTIEQTSFQCSISQNVINDKFYSFLWYWFQFLILFNTIKIVYQIMISNIKHCNSLRRALIWREIEEEKMLTTVLRQTTVGGWLVLKHVSSRSDNDLFEMIIVAIYNRLYDSSYDSAMSKNRSIEVSSLMVDEDLKDSGKRSKSTNELDFIERDIENKIISPNMK